jgi:hypothetical protein
MDSAIRRSVEREFPEIAGGYHVPRFARILAVSDAPADAGMCDDFRPRFAADIEVLGPDDEPDPDIPTSRHPDAVQRPASAAHGRR